MWEVYDEELSLEHWLDVQRRRFFFFQAEDGIRDIGVTGVQTCALPIVSVGPLRAKVVEAAAPFVQDVVITGHGRSELGALVLLDEPRVRASLPELADAPLAQLAEAPALVSRLRAALDALQREATGSASRITRLWVLPEAPSIDRGEITDKGSINQRAMLESRPEWVERLYGASAESDPRVIF